MELFEDKKNKLIALQKDGLLGLLADIIEENEDLITQLNKNQLSEGKKSDGSYVTPPYTPYTVVRKKQKGQRYDVVTLKDTGEFYASLRIKQQDTSFEIDDNDSKAPKLLKKYGDKILGLSSESLSIVIERVKPILIERVKYFLS